ncbi:MAG: hypothetical protein M1495_19345 [Bacteroidetes bacterium]|nr:hypothetical protein [Bacteroidota bacterium]
MRVGSINRAVSAKLFAVQLFIVFSSSIVFGENLRLLKEQNFFSFGSFEVRIEAMVPRNFNTNMESSGGNIIIDQK